MIREIKTWGFFGLISALTSCATTSKSITSQEILIDRAGWKVVQLDKGLTHFEFPFQYVEEIQSNQNVNVLAIDLKKSKYKILVEDFEPVDSLSAAVSKYPNAVAAINGTYFEKKANSGTSTSYFKSGGKLIDSVQVKPESQYGWKHEGAFYLKNNHPGIVRGDNSIYNALGASDVISGSPLLIENYHPSGVHFARAYSGDLNQLHYENPDRHQGVRHPRTALAILPNEVVLFVTVDGRNEKAAGMSAKELTIFLRKYFNPKDALNIDGGGSTTFWLKQDTRSKTHVINYPTDNKKLNHYGQRRIKNGLVVVK